MTPLLLLLLAACGKEDAGEDPKGGKDSAGDTGDGDTGEPEKPLAGCAGKASDPLGGDLCVSGAPCAWTGEQYYEFFGWSIDAGGDFDGDGREDLVVGAPGYDDAEEDVGRAIFVSGAALDEDTEAGGVVGHVAGKAYGDYAGYAVAFAGDADGDGADEVIVGLRGNDDGGENAGQAWLLSRTTDPADVLATFTGESEYARVGTAFDSAGDVDGDGLSDFLITGELKSYDGKEEIFRNGRIYLVTGRDEGWPLSLADADAALDGVGDDEGAGFALAGGEDVDGDGTPDLVAGAPYGASWKGRAYAVSGATLDGARSLAENAVAIDGEAYHDRLGWDVAAGDLTGDGVAEVIAGAPLNDRSWSAAGAIFIYEGGAGFFEGTPEPIAVIVGEWDEFELGMGTVAGRDLDGDGTGDLVAGAVQGYAGLVTKGGTAYLFSGGKGLNAEVAASAAGVKVHGARVKDYLGGENAMGDLDGDGQSDLVVASGYADHGTTADAGALYVFWGGGS